MNSQVGFRVIWGLSQKLIPKTPTSPNSQIVIENDVSLPLQLGDSSEMILKTLSRDLLLSPIRHTGHSWVREKVRLTMAQTWRISEKVPHPLQFDQISSGMRSKIWSFQLCLNTWRINCKASRIICNLHNSTPSGCRDYIRQLFS